jgi:hypothetical protein
LGDKVEHMDTPPAKSYIVELNEAARRCSKEDWRRALQLAAVRLHNAIEELHKLPTQPTMQEANAAWVRAHFLLTHLPPEAGPAGPTVAEMDWDRARLAA